LKGILLIDKPQGKSSFFLVSVLRRLTGVKKIGHAGTLDPLATGVMVMLIGREFTRLSDQFLTTDKEYEATITLGQATDSYDSEGEITDSSDKVPTLDQVQLALKSFQGDVLQTPPMYSAKKVNGKKLYELARKGQIIERKSVPVKMTTTLIDYTYPLLKVTVKCSKGTYIRSIAHDLGLALETFGHISELRRTKSGSFNIKDCLTLEALESKGINAHLISTSPLDLSPL